ncbi:MAG: ferric reductase-like transmembrane domain-containing protein [Pseudomonadota bacterium]
MNFRPTRFFWLVATTLLITTVLWAGANQASLLRASLSPWRALAQLAGLWSTSTAILALLSIVRSSAMEFFFGGLDQAVRLHRKLGLAALLLQGGHVLFMTILLASRGVSVALALVPEASNVRRLDIVVAYALLLLGALAYGRWLRHEWWLRLHRLIGLLFLAGVVSASTLNGVTQAFEPLRTWVVILFLLGSVAWIYQAFLFRAYGPRFRYQLVTATLRNHDIVDLLMRPTDKRMMYLPGAFVFLRVPGFKGSNRELHPFSISSSPNERELRLSCRRVGDYTEQLATLASLAPNQTRDLDLYGPFGAFTPHHYAPYRRMIWIGAGIGITPFLSMVAFERGNQDFRRIWLYYAARSPEDAVYDQELKDNIARADSLIDYTLWLSGTNGRLSAARILADIELDDYAVMLCGSKSFVAEMAAGFRAAGLAPERIIVEELQFR